MTRRGSENSHEDEEGGGRALGLAAGGGLLPLAGAAAGLESATTTKQKREQEHRPAIRKETGNPRSGTETGGDPTCRRPSSRCRPCPSWWLELGFCGGTGRWLSNRGAVAEGGGLVVGFALFGGSAFMRCAAAWVCVREREKQGQRPGGCGIRDAWLVRWIV
jgi:hypothetical protein